MQWSLGGPVDITLAVLLRTRKGKIRARIWTLQRTRPKLEKTKNCVVKKDYNKNAERKVKKQKKHKVKE